MLVDCTGCHYCMPCPQGINIPLLFGLMNDSALFGNAAAERSLHDMLVHAGQTAPASACSKCEQCVEACPQQLEVTRELEGVAEMFENRARGVTE